MRRLAVYGLWILMILMPACGARDQSAAAPTAKSGPAAASSDASTSIAPPRPEVIVPAPSIGRYQIVSNAQGRTAPFLLDTQEGRVWQLKEFSGLEGSPAAWQEMTVIDDKGRLGITTPQFQKLYPARHRR